MGDGTLFYSNLKIDLGEGYINQSLVEPIPSEITDEIFGTEGLDLGQLKADGEISFVFSVEVDSPEDLDIRIHWYK